MKKITLSKDEEIELTEREEEMWDDGEWVGFGRGFLCAFIGSIVGIILGFVLN